MIQFHQRIEGAKTSSMSMKPSMQDATPNNRVLLKRQTEYAHAVSEAQFWNEKGFINRATYDDFLAGLFRAHHLLGQPSALSLGDLSGAAHERLAIAALERDLGRTEPKPRICNTFTPSFAWGVRYALVGSHIGASAILNSGTLSGSWPCAYLQGAREFAQDGGVGTFFRRLNSARIDIDDAADGATAVFNCLRRAPDPIAEFTP